MDNIPTFVPPVGNTSGRSCHYHTNEEAVTSCARCGKPICRDCAETYEVAIGEYAGKAICYDCCKDIVAQNVKNLKKNRLSILYTFITTLIGIAVGLFIAFGIKSQYPEGGIPLYIFIVFPVIGGCFWTFLKGWISRIRAAYDGDNVIISLLIGISFGLVIEVILSFYRTIRKIILSIVYLIKTSGFIKSDSRALRDMNDYMEYTLIRNQNVGVDIQTLLNENENLRNNSYAQDVARNGEQNAENRVRGLVTTINENGEIIRSFAA